MESVVGLDPSFWRGRAVFLTGHTGFKGAWLSLWLRRLGAIVHGYSLDPPTEPSLFEVTGLGRTIASDTRADLADLERLKAAMGDARPEVVLHLAAQALVRESYRNPLGTLASNVAGTAHVLEGVRETPSVRAVVLVTTDKVYENREDLDPYREEDSLGGRDPYSASKAAAEIVAASYRSSFFGPGKSSAFVATARAGNVIGGGDWAVDRLVPDCHRAFSRGDVVRIRFPHAVRPWQHVLEPLSGYLRLSECLLSPQGAHFARAWNFGPDASGDATVSEVTETVARYWGGGARVELVSSPLDPHEAGQLRLDSTRARRELAWLPRWSLSEALERTVAWHRRFGEGADMTHVTLEQIAEYEEAPTK